MGDYNRKKYHICSLIALNAFSLWNLYYSSTVVIIPQEPDTKPKTKQAEEYVKNDNNKPLSLPSEPNYNEILDELDVLSGGAEAKYLKCPHPLVPFENIIFKKVNTTNNKSANDDEKQLLIPKILHVSLKSRCLPQDLAEYLNRWHTVLPTYSIFFHDDEAVSRMFEHDWSEFPNLHEAMKCVIFKGAIKIDLWRVLLLYKYGGVYTDIDNWPLDTFNDTTIRSDLSAFFLTDGFNRPSQWFMATEPRHPIMDIVMKTIILNVLNIENLSFIKAVRTTGPEGLKAGYREFLKEAANWTLSDVIMTGRYGKKVMKKANYEGNSKKYKFIEPKYGYSKTVVYNSTTNMTVKERIELESGLKHWTKVRNIASKNHLVPRISCRRYIESLANGAIAEIKPI